MSEENKKVAKEEVEKVEALATDKVEETTVVVDKSNEEVLENKPKSKAKKSTKKTVEVTAEKVEVENEVVNVSSRNLNDMYWTLELASKLEDAPWPANKDELIDFAIRSGAPMEVVENLQELEDDGEMYDSIEDIWPDYPDKDDFFFNEDEY